ncbi:MAG: hypothetical protein PHS82_06305 [Lachnospiraceae bacterium]|nr:hypothetical protein [Lachnospiraceae bacterium]
MPEEQLKLYYNTYTQCWKLFRKYVQVEIINDTAWNCMISDFEKLRKEIEGDEPSYQILWGTQKAIDKIWTKREKERSPDKVEEEKGFCV